MEEDFKGKHVPVFGYWNACDEQPDLYFEFSGEDGNCQMNNEEKLKRLKVSKAVDEDLYKIPPELIYQKSQRGSSFFSESMASVEVESAPVVEVKTTHEDAPSTQAIEVVQDTLHSTITALEEPANKVDEPILINPVVEEEKTVEDPIVLETVPVEVGDEKAIVAANVVLPEAAEEVKTEGLVEKLEDEPLAVPAIEKDMKVDQVVEEKPIEEEPALTEEVKVEVVEEKLEQEPSVEPTLTTNDLKVENVEVKSEVLEGNTEEEEKNVVL
ncbi:hypothetical protein J5N97_007313 [Dioscorea zingiberensis]|uniref:Uncharacterized protein n=1 Tax=Dioscorea zingiberensis TaxID=325984 RepID=A0A9D5DFM0_9LILI|nr:hypothetical protein J5N97_007313 [Dioscorea zingiberensis]